MSKKRTWIVVFIVGGVLILGGVAASVASQRYQDHDWNLGLAPQKSAADIQAIQAAVDTVQEGIVIDTHVENANTSGTPFGHSVQVNVLLDANKLSANDTTDIDAFVADVKEAIDVTGVKGAYDLTVGLHINPAVTSGDGSRDSPLTNAERMSASDIVYEESFEI